MQLSGYVAVIRRWWWTLLIAAWVAGLSAFLVAQRLPPTYESQTQLLVGPINTDANTLRASGQLVQTYATIATTEPLLTSAIQETGIDANAQALAELTRATANDVTRILTIRVQWGTPDGAATLANAIGTEMIQLASRGISRPEGEIQVISFAMPVPEPVAPQVSLLVMVAVAAGVVGAIVLVMLIEYLSDVVRTREDLAQVANAPFLGSISGRGRDPLAGSSTRAGQAYRLLAAKLLSREGDGSRSLVVIDTASRHSAGIAAANIAVAAARLGQTVVLIDGDGPDGSVTTMFRLQGTSGTADILAGNTTPQGVARTTQGIVVIPGGTETPETVDVDRCREVIEAASSAADLVVVACRPVRESAVTLSWARAAGRVVLVAQRDQAKRTDVSFAADSIAQVHARLVGVILREGGGSTKPPQALPGAAPSPAQLSFASDPAPNATRRSSDSVRSPDPDDDDGAITSTRNVRRTRPRTSRTTAE